MSNIENNQILDNEEKEELANKKKTFKFNLTIIRKYNIQKGKSKKLVKILFKRINKNF
jgi:hypothetical protein